MASPAIQEQYRVVASRDDRGAHVFCVLVKRSYEIVPGKAAVRAAPAPLHLMDTFYEPGDPEICSLRYENDLTPFKIATDVVVIGTAYAPGGRPAQSCDASVEIAGRRKAIRVIGDRQCVYRGGGAPGFTDPQPFTSIPVRYERAYGGTDGKSIPAMPYPYPRNPVGRGLALHNRAEVVDGLPLPNFEDPADLLSPERIVLGEPEGWSRQPLPQGFGWFQRNWYPRCSFAGAVPGFVEPDAVLKEETLGLVPRGQIAAARRFQLPSFDIRFNSGASPGLMMPWLAGGERVRLTNLTPEGALEFTLPGEMPRLALDIGFGLRELEARLHTVTIRIEERQLDQVWRGAHEFPGIDWLPEMRRLQAEVH